LVPVSLAAPEQFELGPEHSRGRLCHTSLQILVIVVVGPVLRVLLALVGQVEVVLVFSLHLHTHEFHTIPEVGVFPVVYKSCIPYFYPRFSKIKFFTRLGGNRSTRIPSASPVNLFATPFGPCGDGYVMRGRNYSVFKEHHGLQKPILVLDPLALGRFFTPPRKTENSWPDQQKLSSILAKTALVSGTPVQQPLHSAVLRRHIQIG
jgi:hypothetical protein